MSVPVGGALTCRPRTHLRHENLHQWGGEGGRGGVGEEQEREGEREGGRGGGRGREGGEREREREGGGGGGGGETGGKEVKRNATHHKFIGEPQYGVK